MKKLSKKLTAAFMAVVMVFTLLPLNIFTAYAATLSDANAAYEAKITEMKNGSKIYKNLSAAYAAYIAANASGATQSDYNALMTAVNNMTEFSAKKAHYTVSINGMDATANGTNYYSNVLYADTSDALYSKTVSKEMRQTSGAFGVLKYSNDVFLYQPSGVLLYDGDAMVLPVVVAVQDNRDEYNWRFQYIALNATDSSLYGLWYGHSQATRGTDNIVWPTVSTYKFSNASSDSETWDANASTSSGGIGYYSNYYNFRNGIRFTIDPNNYYSELTDFNWNFHLNWYNSVTGGVHDYDDEIETNNPVYIVNYKALLEAMDSAVEDNQTLFNVSNYKEGGIEDLFKAFDEATTLDPTSSDYAYGEDMETAAKAAATDIQKVVEHLQNIETSSASFGVLKSAIEEYEQNMSELPFRTNLADAYEHYLKAKEYYDSYVYGKNRDAQFMEDLQTEANEFTKAINKSKAFVDKDGDIHLVDGEYAPSDNSSKKYFENDAVYTDGLTLDEEYAQAGANTNVLYYPMVQFNSEYITTPSSSNSAEVYMGVHYPYDIVLLYNGEKNPAFPVMYTAYKSDWTAYDRYVYGLYPASWNQSTYTDKDGTRNDGATVTPNENFIIKDGLQEVKSLDGKKAIHKYWYSSAVSGSNVNLNWPGLWVKSDNEDTVSVIIGSNTETTPNINRYYVQVYNNDSSKRGAGAAVIEYKDNGDFDEFTGSTDIDNYTGYYKKYSNMNWYYSYGYAYGIFSYYHCSAVTASDSDITVINTTPLKVTLEELSKNNNIKNVLKYIYQYDSDSADMITLLKAIDKVGSFNPNDYDYSDITDNGDGTYTNNGVTACVNDMKTVMQNASEIAPLVEGGTKIVDQPDTNKTSTSTNDGSSEDLMPDTSNWYGTLRDALLNPITVDDCYNETLFTAYKNLYAKAQKAINATVSSDSYYPESYDAETVVNIADNLNTAKAALLSADKVHNYKYKSEDELSIGRFDCNKNGLHTPSYADMNAYNELSIAYSTIDIEAYVGDVAVELADVKENKFDVVKTDAATAGLTAQQYVDNGVFDLLSAINEASETTTDGEGQTVDNLNTYTVTFRLNLDGSLIDDTVTYSGVKFGSTFSLNAETFAAFPEGATCYSWTVQRDGGEEVKLYHKENTLNNFIQGNTTVTAFVNSDPATNTIPVYIMGTSARTLYAINADKDATVEFGTVNENDKTITVKIGDDTYTISSTSGYDITGWTIGVQQNTTEYAGNSDYTVGELQEIVGLSYLKLIPHVQKKQEQTFTIAFADGDGTISFGGNTDTSISGITYDDKILATAVPDSDKGEAIAIAFYDSLSESYIPVTYLDENVSSYKFYANRSMDFYLIYTKVVTKGTASVNAYYVYNEGTLVELTDATQRYYLNRRLPFVYSYIDTTTNASKFVLRAAYTANSSANITEHGMVYFTARSAEAVAAAGLSSNDLTIGHTNVSKFPASKTVNEESMQYSISNTRPSGYFYFYGRAYIKFTYVFSQTNSEGQTVESTIEAVSYGYGDEFLKTE